MRRIFLFIPAIVTIVCSFIFTFTFWPEMLNFPWFMGRGLLPYHDFAILFTPGLPFLIMVVEKIIGFSPLAVHIVGTALLAITNLLLTWAIYRETKNKSAAIITGFFLIYLFMAFGANHLWPDSLLTPLLFLICYCHFIFLKTGGRRVLFLSGIIFGLGLLTKQIVLYMIPEFILILFYKRPLKFACYYITPIIGIIIAFLIVVAKLGILYDFYNWGIKFVFLISSSADSYIRQQVKLPDIGELVYTISLILMSVFVAYRERSFRGWFLVLWVALLSFFIYPRFGYFHLEPALIIFLFLLAVTFKNNIKKMILVYFCLFLFFLPLLRKNASFGSSLFLEPEIVSIANDLKNNYPGATLATINSPEQIMFLSDKLPTVKPWPEQLSWMLKYADVEFSQAFLANPPDLILFTPFKPTDYEPALMKYAKNNYFEIKKYNPSIFLLQRKVTQTDTQIGREKNL